MVVTLKFEDIFVKKNWFFGVVSGLVLINSLLVSRPAFAGGGDTSGGGSTPIPPTNQAGNTPIVTGGNGVGNGTTVQNGNVGVSSTNGTLINNSITPISPLQSSYSQTTSYFNSGTTQACGLSINGGVGNSNTLKETVYQVGFNYATQKCVDVKKLEVIRQEAETKRAKLNVQGDVLINCMKERTNALSLKQNPDSVCKVPDLSQIDSLLH
jgi:hypothetical protein